MSGSQSQKVAQAPALVGEANRSPAANAATTTTLFNLCSFLDAGRENPLSATAVRPR
jgi:hypothetical protein